MKEWFRKIKAIIRDWSILIVVSILDLSLLAYGIANQDSMTALAWALLAVIILALTFYGFSLRKATKESFPNKWIAYTVLSLGILFIIYLVPHSSEIKPADWAEILLMLGLVAVTGLYAMSAFRQAKASEKMAEEMKEQRYNSVRPLIDIRHIEHGESWAESEALRTEQRKEAYGDYSQGLSCRLHNIGVGPATDVYSFVQTPDGKCQLLPFGALAEDGKTDKYRLSLKQSDNRTVLIAYYRDVYDNCFESSREVITGKVHLGQLKIRKIPKEESPK